MCSLAPTLSVDLQLRGRGGRGTTLSVTTLSPPPDPVGSRQEGPRGPSVEGMRRQVEGALDRVDTAEKRVGKVAHRFETRPPPGGGGGGA